MILKQAELIANKYRDLLKPFCHRIEVAGSVRRKKPEVKDIELVCIRNTSKMFQFIGIINSLKKIKGEPFGKYTQRELPEGINMDLFMCNKDNWGFIYAIRTGSADFSHNVLGKGWIRAGYKSINGSLFKNNKIFPIQEEMDLFNLIGLNYIQPENRI